MCVMTREMTYFGWAGDRPLALVLEQRSQLSQLHCVGRPVAGGSPVALGHRGSLVRRHEDGTSGPSGFSLGRVWGLLAPGARELPVMGTLEANTDTVLTVYPSDVSFLKSILRKRQPLTHTLSSPRGQLTASLLLCTISLY